jgi:hypothetical protein
VEGKQRRYIAITNKNEGEREKRLEMIKEGIIGLTLRFKKIEKGTKEKQN